MGPEPHIVGKQKLPPSTMSSDIFIFMFLILQDLNHDNCYPQIAPDLNTEFYQAVNMFYKI